ncbi:hypothetical protein ASPBRDRAFT_48195 [Aspergillus brasiliensis CBS 101740]|uniref:Uncharacterized protein n=1 Tax=Aspergillus brasiliensis (strain CBS 101740 / IMI 381727 / IBT 21946) TaxID=767769 RepID=A0A1L9U6B6_ASPBC|nr:hypothetical protein ASPBRDRAFT_48195 [Aspergillus brasiliensis CBS 101740]
MGLTTEDALSRIKRKGKGGPGERDNKLQTTNARLRNERERVKGRGSEEAGLLGKMSQSLPRSEEFLSEFV